MLSRIELAESLLSSSGQLGLGSFSGGARQGWLSGGGSSSEYSRKVAGTQQFGHISSAEEASVPANKPYAASAPGDFSWARVPRQDCSKPLLPVPRPGLASAVKLRYFGLVQSRAPAWLANNHPEWPPALSGTVALATNVSLYLRLFEKPWSIV